MQTTKHMIDNRDQTVADHLRQNLTRADFLRVVSAYFSIYGYKTLQDDSRPPFVTPATTTAIPAYPPRHSRAGGNPEGSEARHPSPSLQRKGTRSEANAGDAQRGRVGLSHQRPIRRQYLRLLQHRLRSLFLHIRRIPVLTQHSPHQHT